MTIERVRMGQQKIYRKLARTGFCCNILILTVSLWGMEGILYRNTGQYTVSKPVSSIWKI